MAGATRNHALIAGGLFLLALAPLLATPVLPLIDFYNHLARFYVLAHVGSDPLLAANYRAHWSLVPDIGLDLAATPILWLLPPLIAGHVIAILIMAVIYGGVLYFHRALTGERSLLVAVLLLPLLYSYVMNWGFAPFLFALGLAFWAAGWWLDHRGRPKLAVPVASLFALLLFLAHGVAFALYGILLASLEVGFFLTAPKRDWRELIRRLAQLAAQAVVPVLIFLAWHSGAGLAAKDSGLSPQALMDGMFVRPGHPGTHRLSTILRVEEGPAYWFDIATFLIQAILILFLIWRRKLWVVRPAWPSIGICLLLVWLCPPIMFGVDYVADRVPLFAAMVLLGSLVPARTWTRQAVIAGIILAATVAVRLGATVVDWYGYRETAEEFHSIARLIPPGSMTIGVEVGNGHHESGVSHCEMWAPLLVAQYHQIGPLFSIKGQHPLLVKGRLEQAMNTMKSFSPAPSEKTVDFNPYMTAAVAAGYDYLLVCNRQLLTHSYPRGLEPMAQTPHFTLLRRSMHAF